MSIRIGVALLRKISRLFGGILGMGGNVIPGKRIPPEPGVFRHLWIPVLTGMRIEKAFGGTSV
jgi:hypothetical protein